MSEAGRARSRLSRAEVQDALDYADQSPDPPLESLYTDVYAESG